MYIYNLKRKFAWLPTRVLDNYFPGNNHKWVWLTHYYKKEPRQYLR